MDRIILLATEVANSCKADETNGAQEVRSYSSSSAVLLRFCFYRLASGKRRQPLWEALGELAVHDCFRLLECLTPYTLQVDRGGQLLDKVLLHGSTRLRETIDVIPQILAIEVASLWSVFPTRSLSPILFHLFSSCPRLWEKGDFVVWVLVERGKYCPRVGKNGR